jgi:branched-chain amino acid transport system ATP-binding protein
MPLLSLEAVERRFGGLSAVAGVSLAAEPGRITGLIGPNGAGKTTVINLITGLLKLTAGRVMFDGADIGRDPPHRVARAGIARTFQNIRLLADQSVAANVAAGFHMRHGGALPALLGLPSARRGAPAGRREWTPLPCSTASAWRVTRSTLRARSPMAISARWRSCARLRRRRACCCSMSPSPG